MTDRGNGLRLSVTGIVCEPFVFKMMIQHFVAIKLRCRKVNILNKNAVILNVLDDNPPVPHYPFVTDNKNDTGLICKIYLVHNFGFESYSTEV